MKIKTTKKTQPKGMFIQLTHPRDPSSMIETVDGNILGFDIWCRREADRVRRIPARYAYVCEDEKGRIALWVNRVSGDSDTRDEPERDIRKRAVY